MNSQATQPSGQRSGRFLSVRLLIVCSVFACVLGQLGWCGLALATDETPVEHGETRIPVVDGSVDGGEP